MPIITENGMPIDKKRPSLTFESNPVSVNLLTGLLPANEKKGNKIPVIFDRFPVYTPQEEKMMGKV